MEPVLKPGLRLGEIKEAVEMISFLIWLFLALCAADMVIMPFLVGRERKPYSGTHCLSSVFVFAMVLFMSGRIFGWW